MPALNGDPSGFSAVPNAEFGPRARLRSRSETEGLRPDSCCELSVHPAGACLHGLVNLSLSNGVSSLGQPNRRQRRVPATARLVFCGGNVYHTAHQNVDCVRVATAQYTHLFEGTAVKCECAYTWFSICSLVDGAQDCSCFLVRHKAGFAFAQQDHWFSNKTSFHHLIHSYE